MLKMLNRHNLNIASLCCTGSSRFMLSGIKITPQETVVTDGHLMLKVTTPDIEAKDAPDIDGFIIADEFEPFILGQKQALEIARAIPKSPIKILENAFMGAGSEVAAEIATTDMDLPKVFKPRKLEGEFPDVDAIMPKGEPVFEIHFDVHKLIDLLKQVESAIDDKRCAEVLLSFYSKKEPMRIDAVNKKTGQRICGLIMSCKGTVERNYPMSAEEVSDPAIDELKVEEASK